LCISQKNVKVFRRSNWVHFGSNPFSIRFI
jgi:hypothetical protein